MRIVKVLVSNKADTMTAENGTAVNSRDIDMNKYHFLILFVETEKIRDPDIWLRDVSLLLVTSLRASFPLTFSATVVAHYL